MVPNFFKAMNNKNYVGESLFNAKLNIALFVRIRYQLVWCIFKLSAYL